MDRYINKDDLIIWLLQQKYITVNEHDDSMIEEYEKEHQWELSRNCFINKIINHIDNEM